MIFQQTWEQVVGGTKTQTRRLWKYGDWAGFGDAERHDPADIIRHQLWIGIPLYVRRNGRAYVDFGHTYAVQSGRGQKAVGRIRITGIRLERLQDITAQDAWMELGMRPDTSDDGPTTINDFARLWDSIRRKRGERWADNPLVWVLTFELVKEAGDEHNT